MAAFHGQYGGGAWDPEEEHSGTTLESPLPVPVSAGFAGKVAIVTGAGSGFGEGIAKRFAEEGRNLIHGRFATVDSGVLHANERGTLRYLGGGGGQGVDMLARPAASFLLQIEADAST